MPNTVHSFKVSLGNLENIRTDLASGDVHMAAVDAHAGVGERLHDRLVDKLQHETQTADTQVFKPKDDRGGSSV